MTVDQRLGGSARTVVDVDVGPLAILGDRDLNRRHASPLAEVDWVFFMKDRVVLVAEELPRPGQHLLRVWHKRDVESELLVAAQPLDLPGDLVDGCQQLERVMPERSALVVIEP